MLQTKVDDDPLKMHKCIKLLQRRGNAAVLLRRRDIPICMTGNGASAPLPYRRQAAAAVAASEPALFAGASALSPGHTCVCILYTRPRTATGSFRGHQTRMSFVRV